MNTGLAKGKRKPEIDDRSIIIGPLIKSFIDLCHFQPKGRGGTLIFSHIRRLGLFFLGYKILNFNIFWVFRQMNIFGGMKILWIFFGVITKLG